MINPLVIVLLTLLTVLDLSIIGIMAHFGKNSKTKSDRTGFVFLTVLMVLNIVCSIGGATLW